MTIDYRHDFPLLQRKEANAPPIAFLDNASTTQKPRTVINAVVDYYENYNANPHRGAYRIAERVTEAMEQVRAKVARFIGAASAETIVFTSGATDGFNLVAERFGPTVVGPGDEILISKLEHHSNLLPWQRLAQERQATLNYLTPDEHGRLTLENFKENLTDRTKLVAITHVSNVMGVVNPVKAIIEAAHAKGALVMLDAAQSAPHLRLNVTELDVDFLAFSGHKMLAPAGIGVLYGKKALLDIMPPGRIGGGIVEDVQEQSVRYLEAPHKFEAGTQNAEGIIGLGAAIDYLETIGFDEIARIDHDLMVYAAEKLADTPHLIRYGTREHEKRLGIVSFNITDIHPHDTATILAASGVAIRAGHHCAQPLMAHLKVHATCRLSSYFYNTKDDIDRFVAAISQVRKVMGYGS